MVGQIVFRSPRRNYSHDDAVDALRYAVVYTKWVRDNARHILELIASLRWMHKTA